jgi:hypothetical protein
MENDVTDHLLHLRIIVLSLGESHHATWWCSQFLSPTGISYLARLYPHTRFAEAIRSAARGALELHDASIGKGGVYHLFRLPNGYEIQIEDHLIERCSELESTYVPILNDQARLVDRLSELAGDNVNLKSGGAIQITIKNDTIASKLASVYLWAFQNGKHAFPYFLQDKE